jgi:UPF0755 protein
MRTSYWIKYFLLLALVAPVFLYSCKQKKKKETVKIVINKLRTKNDLAKKLATVMQDSEANYNLYLQNNDSLKVFGKDSNTIMSGIIPNTYEVFKGTEAKKVLKKILDYENLYWNAERKAKAQKFGYTPHQIYTLASIVEEETIKEEDKGKIASVYFNRLKKNMKLEADPTLKFAINDFSLTRILLKHKDMAAKSPYSTYAFTGLPPGPICTPSTKTIDAVLNSPETDYIFFVAQPNFSGLSNFTADYKVHLQNAAVYHKFLDSIFLARKGQPK